MSDSLSTEARLDIARNAVEIELAITQSLLSIVNTHLVVGSSGGRMARRSDESVRRAVGDAREHFIELCRLANVFEETRASAVVAIEAAQNYRSERGPMRDAGQLEGAA